MSMNLTAALEDAYGQFMRKCDGPEHMTGGTFSSACSFLLIYAVGVFLQLCILPANFRLAKNRSAFLLLLHINFLDLAWLLQYIWLCMEFIVLGRRLIVPFSMDAYLFRLVNFSIDALYIELALNRTMAVLDGQGRIFERLFSQKNNKIYLVSTWFSAALYSIYTNWHPTRRPFHCLMQLGYFEPTTSIPKSLLGLLPDTLFYDGIQQIYMVSIYIPLLLYIAAFSKLFYKFIERLCCDYSTVSVEAPNPPSPTTTTAGPKLANAQFANLALERSRLFLLCFFSQLPYLMANGLFHLSRIFQIDDQVVKVMAKFWQFFGTIFHVQQPIVMLLLSSDMRREVKGDARRVLAQFKRKLLN